MDSDARRWEPPGGRGGSCGRRKGFTIDPPINTDPGEGVAFSDQYINRELTRGTRATAGLAAGSAAFAVSNVLLVLAAVFASGTLHLGSFDAGRIALLSMAIDTLAAALFAWSLWRLAAARGGRVRRWLLRSALVFVAWAFLALTWRFLLPMAAGMDAEGVFWELFTPEDIVPRTAGPAILNGMLALWTLASAVFVLAQLALLAAREHATDSDPLKRLPATGWVVSAAVSCLGTLLVVFALGTQLQGGSLSDVFLPGALLKMLIAPALFLGAYLEAVRWGWDQLQRARAGPTAEPDA